MRNTYGVVMMRLALAQVNYTVGDLAGNAEIVIERTRQATAADADLVAFPEMTLTGYPPEDLVLRASFRTASRSALVQVAHDLDAAGLGNTAVVLGYLDDAGGPRNACAFLFGGAVVGRYYKHHLPNYGVFDERRYFVPGGDLLVIRHLGVDIALTICEDVWQDGGPFTVAGLAQVGLVVNINGSPYERRKGDARLPLLQRRAAEAHAPVLYVNTVGGQDELVFDGDSMVIAPEGSTLLRATRYEEGVCLVDIDLAPALPSPPEVSGAEMSVTRLTSAAPTARRAAAAAPVRTQQASVAAPLSDEAEVWGAIVTGLRDYVAKNGFRSVVLGMSGGIDSAVVAALAADAIGGGNVFGISMPSAYSSDHSRSDAADLARRLGAHYRVVPIAAMVDAFVSSLSLAGLAEENVQARVRGTTLMALSNAEGHLVLATGNKSELAVGYSTIYGDAVGGFAPIKDVPKSLVWAIARWRNELARARGETPPIPPNSIAKPPSAELRPGQLDTDSLPDYTQLDAIIGRYVDQDADVETIVADGFDRELVARIADLIDGAEWKRRQYPPGPKISFKAFGRDRRLPITNRWRAPE
ncbi:MAG: NAD+ synthase [Actinomycetota bacterium]|nr:NAD+ synthase [Actinomycetota bacterium]